MNIYKIQYQIKWKSFYFIQKKDEKEKVGLFKKPVLKKSGDAAAGGAPEEGGKIFPPVGRRGSLKPVGDVVNIFSS
jgi:hypothetical protein